MKKAISILLALLILTGTLAGCGSEPANETTTGTTAVETTAEETTAAPETTTAAPALTDDQLLALSASDFLDYVSNIKPQTAEYDKIGLMIARQFLNYIKNKKVNDIAHFIYAADDETCMIFNTINVDSYEIVPSASGELFAILRISKSSSALFPVGTSRWRLGLYLGTDGWIAAPIQLFRNINDPCIDMVNITSDAAKFCYGVSAQLGCLETMDDFNKLIANAESKDELDWFCQELVPLLLENRDGYYSEKAYPVKRTELEALAKRTFGITNIDFRKCSKYNSTDDTIGSGGSGASSYSATLSSSTYDQSTRIHTVVFDYYSDEAGLFKAKTMKYSLRENTDGSLTLLSTRLIYDSGYKLSFTGPEN